MPIERLTPVFSCNFFTVHVISTLNAECDQVKNTVEKQSAGEKCKHWTPFWETRKMWSHPEVFSHLLRTEWLNSTLHCLQQIWFIWIHENGSTKHLCCITSWFQPKNWSMSDSVLALAQQYHGLFAFNLDFLKVSKNMWTVFLNY